MAGDMLHRSIILFISPRIEARAADIKVGIRGVLLRRSLADWSVWLVENEGFLSNGLIRIFPILSISP
jgi:hypothetical protein